MSGNDRILYIKSAISNTKRKKIALNSAEELENIATFNVGKNKT